MTTMIGIGMVVAFAREDTALERARATEECARFFDANGISPPSPLFDDIGDTFYFAKNKQGRFVWGNRLLQEMHGLHGAQGIIGCSDHDFFRRDIADRIRADDLAVMESGEAVKNKLEVIGDASGALRWLFTTKAPLRNRDGVIIGLEGFSRDAQRAEDMIAPFHEFRACIEYLQEHLRDDVSISALAEMSCMSLSTFERKFKQHFSRTPKQYILHMKVHEACRLLPGMRSIARVALETGFGGQSYFTKQFRSVVGITPKQYQRLVIDAERRAA